MPEADLALLKDAAHAAGQVALRYCGETAKSWDKPGGAGPVTEADLAVNEKLEAILRSARPDYGWLSEESEDAGMRLSKGSVFIVDPIDGTRSFMEGSGVWAHSLAVADEGRVTAAVIYLPKRNMLYAAALGQGATLNAERLRCGTRDLLEGAEVLSVRFNLERRHWLDTPPAVKRAYRPSLAYRMALIAQGRFDAILTFRPSWEWDVAAGDLIIREAGGIASDRTGAPLRFNNPTPKVNGIVGANPVLHSEITQRLAIR